MRYRSPSRFCRIGKGLGLAVSLAIAGLWIASLRVQVVYSRCSVSDLYQLYFSAGMLSFSHYEFRIPRAASDAALRNKFELTAKTNPDFKSEPDLFGLTTPDSSMHQDSGIAWQHHYIPIWVLFAIASLVTAFLWYRDRRPRKGHCPRCGYNLTGNQSGICPECATHVPKGEASA